MKASNRKTCLLAIVLGGEMVVFQFVGGEVFSREIAGQEYR